MGLRPLTNDEVLSIGEKFAGKIASIWEAQKLTMRDAVEKFIEWNPEHDPRNIPQEVEPR